MTDCERYEALSSKSEPSPEDFVFLTRHERECTGLHSEAGVEHAQGLPEGALRDGSSEHDLPYAAEVVARIRETL